MDGLFRMGVFLVGNVGWSGFEWPLVLGVVGGVGIGLVVVVKVYWGFEWSMWWGLLT